MRREIESVISAFRLEKNITLIGWVDEARVRAELAAAHALVMPSFAEGLPMVVMEAMAAGRPVIATYIAGLPELVREGENGVAGASWGYGGAGRCDRGSRRDIRRRTQSHGPCRPRRRSAPPRH